MRHAEPTLRDTAATTGGPDHEAATRDRATPPRADPFDVGPYAGPLGALHLGPPCRPSVARRALITGLVAWVPLAALAAIGGLALGADPHASLLLDFSAYARYLVAIPLFILAEAICLPRLARIADHFAAGGLVREADLPRYEALRASTRRLLDSRWTDAVLVALAYTATLALSGRLYPADVATWVAPRIDGARAVSLAGWWRALVSQPLFLMLLLAWLWRVVLWTRFLWRVSRFDLQLIAAHPDGMGGLRFVPTSLWGFVPLAFALGAVGAGTMAGPVVFDDRALSDYQYLVAGLVVLVVGLFAGPLLTFYFPLRGLRSRGTFAYGHAASALGRQFEARWLTSRSADADALGAPDFSATTDLYSIVANVRAINPIMVSVDNVAPLVAATLLPFLPLILVVVPFDEVMRFAAKMLM